MNLFRWDDDPFGVAKKYQSLSKIEWSKVGQRLSPDAGNVTCSKCDADFLATNGDIIPLSAEHDPYGFVSEYQGCKLAKDSLLYLGVYKTSGNAGPVCAECRTEFDSAGDYLRLRATGNSSLENYIDEARPLEDWHRLARLLPAIDREATWREEFDSILREALLTGKISWADRKDLSQVWRSNAELQDPRSKGRILVFKDRVEFQARKNRWSAPLDVITSISVNENVIALDVVGQADPLRFTIVPETVEVDLESGRRQIVLDSSDFADALRLAIAAHPLG